MPRDKAPLCVLALAAFLVALHFIGVLVPGVSGSATHDSAPAPLAWSTSADVADDTDEFATCRDAGEIVDPSSRPAHRDRYRPVVEPSMGRVRGYELTGLPQGNLCASHVASRSAATPALASLQVFRC
ncbi:hypothetical protein OHB35_44365 [Streptomyces phaeochromogenes]|uniref:Secreted protein n=1 Tax=Streptomyces phaeochromogenes TaxID=1923 RepID=A0ABZ1HM81_STRPH|nr:hypothetical protein [Streptomyces phaeochromogenes]WSD19709.1 hypothetical protein OHB35_44365 [Streptomyces phaeochromogenes]